METSTAPSQPAANPPGSQLFAINEAALIAMGIQSLQFFWEAHQFAEWNGNVGFCSAKAFLTSEFTGCVSVSAHQPKKCQPPRKCFFDLKVHRLSFDGLSGAFQAVEIELTGKFALNELTQSRKGAESQRAARFTEARLVFEAIWENSIPGTFVTLKNLCAFAPSRLCVSLR